MRISRILLAVTTTLFIAASATSVHSQQASPSQFLLPALRAASGNSLNPSAAFALESFQPPPRRYGRPNFSRKTSNTDGSNKYEFLLGFGAAVPLGDTHAYQTPNWAFQTGAGRNFNRYFGIILQFDYDQFGLQASTINNQTFIYTYCTVADYNAGHCSPEGPAPSGSAPPIDGNNHVWSFTLNPTFTLATQGLWSPYFAVGGGFYHKVTNFTQPQTQESCTVYGCGFFEVSSNFDHYTSNAGGVNGGFGFTRKFSQSSNARFYIEARYVLILNQPRTGITTTNISTAPLNATNFYPANSHRTTYVPIKLGLRF